MRTAIFISHAAPEDNTFTRWLGAKLELAGYEVWHDLGQLMGGDYFWDKIEEAIRDKSHRFLAVASKASIHKPGVKDEWGLAATIEKSVPGFVIPLRIDDLDYRLFPIAIHRKNAIDFNCGWHAGLSSLIDTLEDARTPKVRDADPAFARQWLPTLKERAILRTPNAEPLDSTWLSLISLPVALSTARMLGGVREIEPTLDNTCLPWFQHEDRIVGFAKSMDLVALMKGSATLKEASGVDTETFISAGSSLGDRPVKPSDARKRVAMLVRQAWELRMEALGLLPHTLAGGRRIFYATPDLTGGKKIAFADPDGTVRKRGLHGRSEKRKVNWAYGVGAVPSFDEPRRVELRASIVFCDDHWKPLESHARAHRLRRSFCRSWWNDRWRGFLRAYLALVAEGSSEIRLPVGSDRHVALGAMPIILAAPSGLSDRAPTVDIDSLDSDDADVEIDLDDGDELDEESEAGS